jgi:hypothetical protein
VLGLKNPDAEGAYSWLCSSTGRAQPLSLRHTPIQPLSLRHTPIQSLWLRHTPIQPLSLRHTPIQPIRGAQVDAPGKLGMRGCCGRLRRMAPEAA